MVHLGESHGPWQLESSIPLRKAAEELHRSHPATLQTLQSLKCEWYILVSSRYLIGEISQGCQQAWKDLCLHGLQLTQRPKPDSLPGKQLNLHPVIPTEVRNHPSFNSLARRGEYRRAENGEAAWQETVAGRGSMQHRHPAPNTRKDMPNAAGAYPCKQHHVIGSNDIRFVPLTCTLHAIKCHNLYTPACPPPPFFTGMNPPAPPVSVRGSRI